VHSLEPG